MPHILLHSLVMHLGTYFKHIYLTSTLYFIISFSELAYSFKATEKSDVYSFGVVLLELLTGLSPTDSQFFGGKDIVFWVSAHLDGQNLGEVFDSRLSNSEDDMLKVLKIAILCTTKLPSLRPTMREVVNMLIDADPCTVVTTTKSYGKNC